MIVSAYNNMKPTFVFLDLLTSSAYAFISRNLPPKSLLWTD